MTLATLPCDKMLHAMEILGTPIAPLVRQN
jgi:hypothetical protein